MPFKHKWSRTNVLPSKEWNLLIDYAEACIEEEKKMVQSLHGLGDIKETT